jgi:peptidoglycan/LPS O-acetylase OafA/YrhL
VGVLAWRVHRAGWLRSGTTLELLSIGLMIAFIWRAGGTRLSLAAPAVFAAVVLVFAVEAGVVSRLLRVPALRWLGERSYSIYMVHFLVWLVLVDGAKLIKRAGLDLVSEIDGSRPWENDVVSLVYFLLVLGVAAVTYRAIEVPARAWFRRLAMPRPRQDARLAMQSAHETL